MNKLILTLTAFASVVLPVIGGEPVGPALANPTTSDQDSLILRILEAVENRDYRTSIIYKLDKETDYFGHKNSSMPSSNKDMHKTLDLISGAGLFQIYPLFRLSPGMTQRSRRRTRNA
jgi:hypothetical protein